MRFSFHGHPLILVNSLPHQYRNFRQFCYICKNLIVPRRWLYYCPDCRYFVHLKCATTSNERIFESRSSEVDNDEYESDENNLVHFPLANEPSIGTIIRKFIKSTDDVGDKIIAPAQINHWVHQEHPILLCNNLENTTNSLLCDGCAGPILTEDQFYGCVQCNFFLHEICAKLPSQLTHPSHSHNLVCGKYTEPYFYIKCNKCKYVCNGMFYSCDRRKFYLDVRCALLANTIKHKAHNHPLNHHQEIVKCACKGCELKNVNGLFGCEECEFHLCTTCTFLPRTIKHRWDPHPIRLVYPPIENHPDEFYCEICEVEINPNHWIYFCRACDQSFHTKCLYPYFAFSNMKFGTTDIKVANHQHSLTFVAMRRHKFGATMCGNCGNDSIPDGSPVLECEPCYLRLCRKCSPSNQVESLVEACERTKEPRPRFYSVIYKKLAPIRFALLVIFLYTFPLWLAYKTALYMWVHPHLLASLIVFWLCVKFRRFVM